MSSSTEMLSDDYGDDIREESFDGFSFGILVLFVVIAYLFCIYFSKMRCLSGNHTVAAEGGPPVGLDETTLTSFPKLVYSKAKGSGKYSIASTGCSICLEDYKESDVVSVLPDCGHFFHLKCINPWLKLHPSCPVCRNPPSSPSPSPASPALR